MALWGAFARAMLTKPTCKLFHQRDNVIGRDVGVLLQDDSVGETMAGRKDSKCHSCMRSTSRNTDCLHCSYVGKLVFGVHTRKGFAVRRSSGEFKRGFLCSSTARVTYFKGFIITAATQLEIQSSPDSSKFRFSVSVSSHQKFISFQIRPERSFGELAARNKVR